MTPKVLRIFGDVRPGETATVLLLAFDVFLIFTAYYLLKVAREPLVLLGGGAEVKSYASFGQTILLIGVADAYGWLAARVSRMKLIALVTIFFLVDLIVFWMLGVRGVNIGVAFFLWVGIFNIVTIAQFWSFAADTYDESQGKRLFPIVGIGSSIGAVSGAWLAAPLIRRGSPFLLMIVAAGIFMASLGITYTVHVREAAREKKKDGVHDPVARGDAFAMVLRDRYLLVFALLAIALNYVTRSGDYVLDRTLLEHAHAMGVAKTAYIGQFKAHYFEWINVIGVVLQLFCVSRIIKHLGLRATLVVIPIASLAGYGTATVAPILGVLVVSRVVESSLDYSLSNTAQQTLWLATSREAKYKAKQVIDSFCRRGGDALSAGVVWLGARYAMHTRVFLAINVAVTGAWIALAWIIGREFTKRTGSPETPQPKLASAAARGAHAHGRSIPTST
jgi:AAA family ATP:ADP antiporter